MENSRKICMQEVQVVVVNRAQSDLLIFQSFVITCENGNFKTKNENENENENKEKERERKEKKNIYIYMKKIK